MANIVDTNKYEGHMVGYYFEGSNFDMEHLTMYDSDGNELGVLKSNNKTLMGGIPFVSPTIEIMCDAPLLLAEYKRMQDVIDTILLEYNKVADKIIREVDEEDRTFEQNALIHIMKICFRVWIPPRFRGDGE